METIILVGFVIACIILRITWDTGLLKRQKEGQLTKFDKMGRLFKIACLLVFIIFICCLIIFEN